MTVLVAGSTSGAIASTAPATLPTPSTSSSALLADGDVADARRRHRRAQVEHPGVGDLDDRRAVAVDRLAGRHQDGRDHAGDRRAQGGAPELHAGDAAGGLRRLEPALGGDDGGVRVVDLLLGGDAVAIEPLGAVELGARVLQLGDGVLALRVGLRHALAQRRRLDVRQRLPDLDRVALGDEDAIDAARHERADLDVACPAGAPARRRRRARRDALLPRRPRP